ncbi:unnamed protein product, partial [Ilex paraguariensis]
IARTIKVEANGLRSFKDLVTAENLAKYNFAPLIQAFPSTDPVEIGLNKELIQKTMEERKRDKLVKKANLLPSKKSKFDHFHSASSSLANALESSSNEPR